MNYAYRICALARNSTYHKKNPPGQNYLYKIWLWSDQETWKSTDLKQTGYDVVMLKFVNDKNKVKICDSDSVVNLSTFKFKLVKLKFCDFEGVVIHKIIWKP